MTAEVLLREIAGDMDLTIHLMWEEKGPPDTMIETHAMWRLDGHLFYVQQFDHGWEVFTVADRSNSVDGTRRAIERIIKED